MALHSTKVHFAMHSAFVTTGHSLTCPVCVCLWCCFRHRTCPYTSSRRSHHNEVHDLTAILLTEACDDVRVELCYNHSQARHPLLIVRQLRGQCYTSKRFLGRKVERVLLTWVSSTPTAHETESFWQLLATIAKNTRRGACMRNGHGKWSMPLLYP